MIFPCSSFFFFKYLQLVELLFFVEVVVRVDPIEDAGYVNEYRKWIDDAEQWYQQPSVALYEWEKDSLRSEESITPPVVEVREWRCVCAEDPAECIGPVFRIVSEDVHVLSMLGVSGKVNNLSLFDSSPGVDLIDFVHRCVIDCGQTNSFSVRVKFNLWIGQEAGNV